MLGLLGLLSLLFSLTRLFWRCDVAQLALENEDSGKMRTFTTFYVCMYIIAFVSHFFKKTLIIILVFLCTTKSDAFLLLKFANYGKLEKWDLFIFLSPFWKWSTLLIFSLIFCILHSCIFELKKSHFWKHKELLWARIMYKWIACSWKWIVG